MFNTFIICQLSTSIKIIIIRKQKCQNVDFWCLSENRFCGITLDARLYDNDNRHASLTLSNRTYINTNESHL